MTQVVPFSGWLHPNLIRNTQMIQKPLVCHIKGTECKEISKTCTKKPIKPKPSLNFDGGLKLLCWLLGSLKSEVMSASQDHHWLITFRGMSSWWGHSKEPDTATVLSGYSVQLSLFPRHWNL